MEKRTKMIIAEDDKDINQLMCKFFASQGYDVVPAYDGVSIQPLLMANSDTDIILLDLMLPLRSGEMVLKKIRESSDVPVIIISARDTIHTKIELLRMGADDYITKPFDLDEIEVRIDTILRRTKTVSPDTPPLTYKNMILDRNSKTVTLNGHRLDITSKEFSILELLMSNPNKLFSKMNLFESVWHEEYFAEDSTLKVHMCNLRNKIRKYDTEEYIETVWGMGYRLMQQT